MERLIVLSDMMTSDWTDLSVMLTSHDYGILSTGLPEEVLPLVLGNECRLVLVDLDACRVDNRFFRTLKAGSPDASIFVFSSRPFHPELKDAMAQHICACFRKPIDSDELLFWLKAVSHLPRTRDPTDNPGDGDSLKLEDNHR